MGGLLRLLKGGDILAKKKEIHWLECPKCKGTGLVYVAVNTTGNIGRNVTCRKCQGKGRVKGRANGRIL